MKKTIEITLPEATTKIKNGDGSYAELFFSPLKQNVSMKLLVDLETVKKATEEDLKNPETLLEFKSIISDYEQIPFRHLQNVVGELKDYGATVTLEQIKSGDISTRLYAAISDLFWKYITSTKSVSEEEEKKEPGVSDLVQG